MFLGFGIYLLGQSTLINISVLAGWLIFDCSPSCLACMSLYGGIWSTSWGNPLKHGENMQTPHRKALPGPGVAEPPSCVYMHTPPQLVPLQHQGCFNFTPGCCKHQLLPIRYNTLDVCAAQCRCPLFFRTYSTLVPLETLNLCTPQPGSNDSWHTGRIIMFSVMSVHSD